MRRQTKPPKPTVNGASSQKLRAREIRTPQGKGLFSRHMPRSFFAKMLQSALDVDNEERVFRLVRLALDNEDPELRRDALKSLSWYGERAISEMIPFLNDPDDSIASEAFNMIDDTLDDIEDTASMVGLVELLTVNYATEEDQVESVLSKLEAVEPSMAAQSILNMLKKTDRQSLLATLIRAEYRDITGENYFSDVLSRKWIREHKPSRRNR